MRKGTGNSRGLIRYPTRIHEFADQRRDTSLSVISAQTVPQARRRDQIKKTARREPWNIPRLQDWETREFAQRASEGMRSRQKESRSSKGFCKSQRKMLSEQVVLLRTQGRPAGQGRPGLRPELRGTETI